MSRNLGWRGAILGLITLYAILLLIPSVARDVSGRWPGFLEKEIRLGLDLQGGMHLVLEVEATKAVESNLERFVEDLRHDLRKRKASPRAVFVS